MPDHYLCAHLMLAEAEQMRGHERITIEGSDPDSGAIVYWKLASGDTDIPVVAREIFPTAASFHYLRLDKPARKNESFIEAATTMESYVIGDSVIYDAHEDSFSATAAPGLPYAHRQPVSILDVGDIVLNPKTNQPYFLCPQTTAFGGDQRGDEIFSSTQLAALGRGQPAITNRRRRPRAPQKRPH